MRKITPKNKANASTTIYEALVFHYAELMKIAKREYYHVYNNKTKSEEDSFKDIAHDTLLKMCKIFDKSETTLKHIKAYFCKAVRMNYVKELISLKPECVDVLPNISSFDADSSNFVIDNNIILSDIETEFGKQDCDIYLKFYQGHKLRELDEEYHIRNSAYIIRKIKNFVTKRYPEHKAKRSKNLS